MPPDELPTATETAIAAPAPARPPAPARIEPASAEYRGVLIELRGEEAASCARGEERPGSAYIDVMGGGDLVWIDKVVTRDELQGHLNRAAAGGLRRVTVRILDGAPEDSLTTVRRKADDAGITTVEVVHLPLR